MLVFFALFLVLLLFFCSSPLVDSLLFFDGFLLEQLPFDLFFFWIDVVFDNIDLL